MPDVSTKFCSACGQVLDARAEICPHCGVRQAPAPNSLASTTPGGKSRLAAALFALLLGGLGVHKFYLGRVGWGIVYLLFFWTFIPAVLGLIEGIIYITMSEEAFAQKYG